MHQGWLVLETPICSCHLPMANFQRHWRKEDSSLFLKKGLRYSLNYSLLFKV